MADRAGARRPRHPSRRPLRQRDRCRGPRVHGLCAHRRARAPDRDAWRARLAGPRVRRSLRQDLRGLRGRRARRRARRYRVAQKGQIRSRPRRRVRPGFPRSDGIGVLVQQDGRAGPPLHGQRGRARMEGMPGRTAQETRREVPVVRRGKGEGSMPEKRLGVGFIGSGFNARFHLQAFQAVRDADVLGVWSPNRQHAEEHSGPHMPWFWRGELQGGGVLNDMMCHSALVVRHLLTKPGAPSSSVRPARVTGHIASLKWTRPEYAKRLQQMMGKDVDYAKAPAEDFASVMIEFAAEDGATVLGEATTSWSFVGPGLRLSAELLGPEYSMAWNSLDSGLQLFFSRAVKGKAGEDLVEKQNAEIGLMPVVAGEPAVYGYEAEDRHFVRAFLKGEPPELTFDDGVEVVKLLMTAYMSAEQGKTLEFPPKGLEAFVPAVAKGTWKP